MESRDRIGFPEEQGLSVDEKMIGSYLKALSSAGRSAGTVSTYRQRLRQMYQMLPEDKKICRGTLEELRDTMQDEKYSRQSLNVFSAAVNGFVEYYGHRELQIPSVLKLTEKIRPELTRSEYLRLLAAAKRVGRQRLYLLIKLFAVTGAIPAQLPGVTVEAVRRGGIWEDSCMLRFPSSLAAELLAYAEKENVKTGAIFVTKNGNNIDRANITKEIGRLADEAFVSPEKCNPRTLRRLYLDTQSGIRENLELLVEQANDRMLEKEERIIGW